MLTIHDVTANQAHCLSDRSLEMVSKFVARHYPAAFFGTVALVPALVLLVAR
jgi:hypothetical protein